ncbi:expression site-associated gene (ESAG-like) protein [Diplonema papillatum]|nr:expression site-associated gene (ESAG-like) protein [Diplonema papillatum]
MRLAQQVLLVMLLGVATFVVHLVAVHREDGTAAAAAPHVVAPAAEKHEGQQDTWDQSDSDGVEDSGGGSDQSQAAAADGARDARPIRFFCMQTKPAAAWCAMLKSASAFGVEIHHPAWGRAYAHAKRIGWVLDAVRGLPSDAVVSFNDGTDVMYNGNASSLLRRFASLEAERGQSLFFNAEKSCYGPQAFPAASCNSHCQWAVRKARCIAAYRNALYANASSSLSKWRYLNAGCFIGRVRAVREFFGKVADITYKPKTREVRKGIWCDQSMITKTLLATPEAFSGLVGLDVDNRIYLSTYHLHADVDFCPPADPGSLHTCHNARHPDEEPLLFHLNGKSASALTSEHHRRLRWSTLEPSDRSGRHYIQGKPRTLASLCYGSGKT